MVGWPFIISWPIIETHKSRAWFWYNLYTFDKGRNLTFLRFLTLDDLQWARDKLFRKSYVKSFILTYNLTTFNSNVRMNQVRNLTVSTFFVIFDLEWRLLTFELLFLKRLCHGFHFDIKFPYFPRFWNLTLHISNYWTSTGRTEVSIIESREFNCDSNALFCVKIGRQGVEQSWNKKADT